MTVYTLCRLPCYYHHWPSRGSCFVKSCHLTAAHTGYLSFGIYCILVSCGSSGWITAVTFMAIWLTDTDRPELSGESKRSKCFHVCICVLFCMCVCVCVRVGWIWFTGGWWWRRAVARRQRPVQTALFAGSYISSPRQMTTAWASTSEEAKSSDWEFMFLSMNHAWFETC